MKKSELKSLIKNIISEQRNMGRPSVGMPSMGQTIEKEIPVPEISDADAKELEQILQREGGTFGTSQRGFEIFFRFRPFRIGIRFVL